jgi:hypothetical protein
MHPLSAGADLPGHNGRVLATCPGCRVELPSSGLPAEARHNASAECWMLYGEVTGFELEHVAALGRFHQLMVDAYGAQHAGEDGRAIRVPYSLVGLHLALERGRSGIEVREAHRRMGRPTASWPDFRRPADRGAVTVLQVAEAGVRVGSVAGHADLVRRWAEGVWQAWSAEHEATAALCARLSLG